MEIRFNFKLAAIAAATTFAALATPAMADINVGISLSSTGPAAALGIPERNTVALLPNTVDGQKVHYIVLDDATDAAQAGKNAYKLVNDDKVDILIGSSSTPASAAIAEVANDSKIAQIAIVPLNLPAAKNYWVFRAVQQNSLMARALIEHMKAHGVKTLGFIGYSESYGEDWLKDMRTLTAAAGIKMGDVERFNRRDTSVTGQALKLVASKPDAILIVASGTPSVLPEVTLKDLGYKKQIYQTHATATKEFIRVGGKAVEGTILPVGPVVVASQLPNSYPFKKLGMEYTKRYEAKYGEGSFSPFGAQLYDAFLLFKAAVPAALKVAKPGTPEFRKALRDAIEKSENVVGTEGVFNMTPTDHFGLDARARVLVEVKNGDWKLLKTSAK